MPSLYRGEHIPNVEALPPASADYRGMQLRVPGGAGAEDVVAICVKADDDTYSWQEIQGGGLPTGSSERQTLRISGGEPRWRDEPNFFGRDYLSGDPADDASPGLASLLSDAHGGSGVGVHGGHIVLEPGEYRLTETLDFTKWTGILSGAGGGISPYYGTTVQHGRGTVLRWDGSAGEPMVRVRDSRDLIIQNIRFEGKDGTEPSYAIEFNSNGGTTGTNEYMTVRDVHIGRYPWTRQGTNKGLVQSGIGFTGNNVNNDQFRIERVAIHYPTTYGVYIPNTQSVGGTIRNLVVLGAGTAAVATAASLRIDDPEFYNCAIDLLMIDPNAPHVIVDNIYSEGSSMIAQMSANGILALHGGNAQVGTIRDGGQVIIDATPSGNQFLSLVDVSFAQNTIPAQARIEIGPASPTTGLFIVNVERVAGLQSSQIVFGSGASMWSSAPMSKGVVTWQSTDDGNIYQFRNELRYSGAGTRTTLDYTAWDAPVTD